MLSAQFGIGGRVRTAKQHGAFGQLIQGFSSILEQHHDGFKVRGIGVAADLADTRRNVGGQLGAIQRFYIMSIDPVELFGIPLRGRLRSEEHTSELQSLMRISYAVFCLKKKKRKQ